MRSLGALTLGWLLLVRPVLAQIPATFGAMTPFSAGADSAPVGLAVADVNGDGKLDLLTANSGTSTAGVLLGTGKGSFGAITTFSTGANSLPNSIAVADVNGDGNPDLLTANYGTNSVGVLLGTGTGSFGAVATFSIGASSRVNSLKVADVNGDGNPDVLTANYGTSTAGVLLGTGTGSFGTITTYSTGVNSSPDDLAVADVNGDGKLDLLTANSRTNTVGMLLGTGTGTFSTVSTVSTGLTGGFFYSLAAADVNGDGKSDVLTATQGTNSVGVLLNTTPTPLATLPALPGPGATLFPNPAHFSSTFQATGLPTAARTVAATLYNSLGQQVCYLTLPATSEAIQAEVPTDHLPAGVYLLHLTISNKWGEELGKLPTQRLVVE